MNRTEGKRKKKRKKRKKKEKEKKKKKKENTEKAKKKKKKENTEKAKKKKRQRNTSTANEINVGEGGRNPLRQVFEKCVGKARRRGETHFVWYLKNVGAR
ncbi:hypothetical protein PVC01_070031400 [Plasmodium vivax]|uniref:(malaria parasite P. vivax) hypothetical protein n=1 Tax=Plasmodium vivax TaxID=5855 RepID=A0A1G4HAV7_PLAVI|nr:unnamed protein product [Plasmodium vivax]SCO72036.1 hypothetical protein PVC01_070031400 [Plasmodium vivax]